MEVFTKVKPKEKKIIGRQPTWTTEYMNMVAQKVVEEGMKYRVAAKTFGVSTGAITQWVKKYKKGSLVQNNADKEQTPDFKIYRLEEQIKELKTEIGEFYLQSQMVKKALFHSQTKKKEISSVITSENLAQFQKAAK